MIENVLKIIFLALGFVKSLEFIYIFQIKEYRRDRFLAHLKENGFVKIFYQTKPRGAAKSIRNSLIILSNCLLFSVLGFATMHFNINVIFITLLLCVSPLFGFLVTSISVFLTGLLSTYKREQLIKLAQEKVANSKTVFIGITGSYGKTTTKEFLYQVLSKRFIVEKTDGTINTDVGIAQSILKKLKNDTQYFILEIGAYKRGEIEKACRIAPISYGILTAIGNQHIELFGSRTNLVAAKSELLLAIKSGGVAYINHDIPEFNLITDQLSVKTVSFSSSKKSDIYISKIKHQKESVHADITYKNREFVIDFKLLGLHNITNLLPIIALSYDLGVARSTIEEAISALQPIPHKLSRHKGIGGSIVISEAGNSNVEGFIEAIKIVAAQPFKRKVIVTKGIIELGSEKEESYRRIIMHLEKADITVYTTDQLFSILSTPRTVLCRDEKEMLKKIKQVADPHTLILIEGKFTRKFIDSVIWNDTTSPL